MKDPKEASRTIFDILRDFGIFTLPFPTKLVLASFPFLSVVDSYYL